MKVPVRFVFVSFTFVFTFRFVLLEISIYWSWFSKIPKTWKKTKLQKPALWNPCRAAQTGRCPASGGLPVAAARTYRPPARPAVRRLLLCIFRVDAGIIVLFCLRYQLLLKNAKNLKKNRFFKPFQKLEKKVEKNKN